MRYDAPFVLIVDANADAAESARDVLSLYGIPAKIAGTCAEAMAVVRRDHPAAVVTDMRLPDGGGDELAGVLQTAGELGPAVIGIGSTERKASDSFSDWFLKPAEPCQLAEALRRYVPRSVVQLG